MIVVNNMYKLLQDINVDNKRVVLRCDLNVPMKDGRILDDLKIEKSLETIKYLMDKNCKIIILSHLGIEGDIEEENTSINTESNNSVEVKADTITRRAVFFIISEHSPSLPARTSLWGSPVLFLKISNALISSTCRLSGDDIVEAYRKYGRLIAKGLIISLSEVISSRG